VRTLAVAMQKGGTGKTTLTANLGLVLGEQLPGQVLLVDADPQASLTTALGFADPDSRFAGATIHAAMLGQRAAADCVVQTPWGFDLIPGNTDLATADMDLALLQEGPAERLGHLRAALHPLEGRYQWVVVDSLPSLGLLALNILVAADAVVVPVQPESAALRSLSTLVRTISGLQARVHPRLRIAAVVVNLFDGRLGHHADALRTIRHLFGDAAVPLAVRRTVRFAEADAAGKPALLYSRDPHVQELRDVLAEVIRRAS
jgi:chromosome partitioning protein